MRTKLVRIMTDRLGKPTLNLANIGRMDEDLDEERTHVRVTNRTSRYKLEHGSDFKHMLEPRDQILEHEFDFTITIDRAEIIRRDFKFAGSQLYWDILHKIRTFLTEATSNVASVAFKFLCQGDLIEKEAKDYAAKNMLLNINSIFLKTVTALENNPIIREKLPEDKRAEIKQTLAIESDYLLSTILLNLTDNYPQAPASGGTPRMRDAILDINRVDEEENDLIYANGIKITDFINAHKDGYTQFIMEVINTAIRVVGSNEGDDRQRTMKEIYTQFNEKLLTLVQQDGYRSFIENLDSKESLAKAPKNNHKSLETKDSAAMPSKDSPPNQLNSDNAQSKARQSVVDYFASILQTNRATLKQIEEKNQMKRINYNDMIENFKRAEGHHLKPEDVKDPEFQFQNARAKAEASVEGQKRDRKFLIGQKIPAYVKEFNQQQMRSSQFEVKHSSILRIMTKWAEYLEEIFQKPEKVAYQRMYPFKTLDNKLVYIDQNYWTGAQTLVSRLKDQHLEVNQKHKELQRQCYAIISGILSQNNDGLGNVARYSSTRTVASKINAVLTFYMTKYLTLLIYHLLLAGKSIWTGARYNDLNLVVFRVADLMRSKFQCTEAQFVSLLKTMYVLDSSESMKGRFKLVRIKNKLDTPANNIIINYLFLGKVQCQLQLSIQEPKGKEKNYYIFSHFVYELTRGKFGPIAECAIMISQLDPMVGASKGIYYLQKKAHPGPLSSMASLQRERQKRERQLESGIREERQKEGDSKQANFQEGSQSQVSKRSIFDCSYCKRMVVNEPRGMFIENNELVCNQCNVKSRYPQKNLKDSTLKDFLLQALEPRKKYLQRIFRWQELKIYFEQQRQRSKLGFVPIAVVNQMGQLELNMTIHIQSQLRSVLVRLDQRILRDLDNTNSFDFTSLDVLDLAKLIQEQKENDTNGLIYSINNLPQVLKVLRIEEEKINERLLGFYGRYIDFRLEKKITKSIKAKSQIINASQKSKYIQKLGTIVDSETRSYKKSQVLDLSQIKQLYAENVDLNHIPEWLRRFSNLKNLNLVKNKIVSVKEDDLPLQLAFIYLNNNQIQSVSLPMLLNLKVLTLNDNRIKTISFNHDLPNLRELNLRKNKISSIIFDRQMPSLVNLSVELSGLKQISFSHDLPSLRILDLNYNDIQSIAFNKNFPSLEQILISGNKLNSISFSNQFPKLNKLFLSENQLSQICLKSFPVLKALYLSQNKLASVKFEEDLPSLVQLYLQDNQLQSLHFEHKYAGLLLLSAKSNKLASITLAHPLNLKVLIVDAEIATNFDFSQLPALKNIQIFKGRVEKDNLRNVREDVSIQYG